MKQLTNEKRITMKTPEEILTKVLNEWDNPNDLDLMSILAKRSLPFMEKAMKEYSKEVNEELIERLADAKYIIKIMYDKIPSEETTARMSTIISEISILLNKIENEHNSK